jgi:molybdopterin-guanine dinucleotide biosynthesis protein MobB
MKRRGLAVGTIRHIIDHSEFFLPEKDTSKHILAGSSVTLAVTSSEMIAIRRGLPRPLEAALSQMPKELDYILVEGYEQSKYPKIIAVNSDSENQTKVPGDTIAIVLDEKRNAKVVKGNRAESFSNEKIVDIIQSYFNSPLSNMINR